jgi:hypothetical protein
MEKQKKMKYEVISKKAASLSSNFSKLAAKS